MSISIPFYLIFSIAMGTPFFTQESAPKLSLNDASKPIVLSQQFLEKIRYSENPQEELAALAQLNPEHLAQSLSNDTLRKTFWINIYNAIVQYALKTDQEQYENRNDFYGKAIITVAGHPLSLNDIEHGILRRSEWQYGLGYVRKWFPDRFEKKMRVEKQDWRIHFALNCGASGCPPILFYKPAELEQQLELAAKGYLKATTDLDGKEASISRLFLFYKNDFGSKKAVIEILKNYEALPPNKEVKNLAYKPYNWTLQLDMYRE